MLKKKQKKTKKKQNRGGGPQGAIIDKITFCSLNRFRLKLIEEFTKIDITSDGPLIGTPNQRVGLYWLFTELKVGGNKW